jgi:hypothetical protein
MSELTDAELKRLIATLAKEKPRSSLGLQYPHTAKIAAQKRKLAKRLEPFFVKAGFDVDGINEVLTQNQNELREILAKPSAREKKFLPRPRRHSIVVLRTNERLLSTYVSKFALPQSTT